MSPTKTGFRPDRGQHGVSSLSSFRLPKSILFLFVAAPLPSLPSELLHGRRTGEGTVVSLGSPQQQVGWEGIGAGKPDAQVAVPGSGSSPSLALRHLFLLWARGPGPADNLSPLPPSASPDWLRPPDWLIQEGKGRQGPGQPPFLRLIQLLSPPPELPFNLSQRPPPGLPPAGLLVTCFQTLEGRPVPVTYKQWLTQINVDWTLECIISFKF